MGSGGFMLPPPGGETPASDRAPPIFPHAISRSDLPTAGAILEGDRAHALLGSV